MFHWIHGASMSLRQRLTVHLAADPLLAALFGSGGNAVVSLHTPEEMGEIPEQGLSLWLYRVIRDEHGRILGSVCLDDYAPSLVELVSLAVDPSQQGKGLGSALIGAAVDLAHRRGYPEIFAVSFSDALFQHCGFAPGDINRYPEKKARYAKTSPEEWTVGQKHCFMIRDP